MQSETERFGEGARVDGDTEYVTQSCCKYIVVELLIYFHCNAERFDIGKIDETLEDNI